MAQRVEIVAGDNDQTALFPTAASLTNPAQTYISNSYVRLLDSALVKTGAGTLAGLHCGAAGTTITVTVYDNTAGSGTIIFSVVLTAGLSVNLNAAFGTGLYVAFSATTGTPNLTVTYR